MSFNLDTDDWDTYQRSRSEIYAARIFVRGGIITVILLILLFLALVWVGMTSDFHRPPPSGGETAGHVVSL